jgi:hypothetical protein
VNQVGDGLGFGRTDNEWTVLDAAGPATGVPRRSKDALADFVLSLVAVKLS